MSKLKYHVPQPERLRRIEGSFAWIDHRLLRGGYLGIMTAQEHGLYLFLALAADRNGVSFYRQEKIADVLGLDSGQLHIARDRLIDLQLIAFQPNGFHQLLPVDTPAPDLAGRALGAVMKQALRRQEPQRAASLGQVMRGL